VPETQQQHLRIHWIDPSLNRMIFGPVRPRVRR
jgi:hypothetical protein